MLLAAARAKRTEAFLIVLARRELGGGVNVQVQAFIAVGAVERARVMITFGHASAVDFQSVGEFH